MTTPANEIDELKATIADLERESRAAKALLSRTIDIVQQKEIKLEIKDLSTQISATRTTLNIILAAQQQGKFPLSFSFFPL